MLHLIICHGRIMPPLAELLFLHVNLAVTLFKHLTKAILMNTQKKQETFGYPSSLDL